MGSTLCATAPSSSMFILGRAIAGTGAAGLIQGAITVITYSSSFEKRPLYIGLVVSCFGICACFSPILGGALTERVSWRWCFWMYIIFDDLLLSSANSGYSNLPIGAAVFVLVLLALQQKGNQEPAKSLPLKDKLKHLDPLGIILLLGVVCCLFLALQWGGTKYNWNSSESIGLLVGFGVLFMAFCAVQSWLGDRGTIPPLLLKQHTVLFGALALFFISMSSNIVCLAPILAD